MSSLSCSYPKTLGLLLLLALWCVPSAMAQEVDLVANEKAVHKQRAALYSQDRNIDTAQFQKIYDEVMAGKRDAYLIDLRSHPEFYAGHIENTDHVSAGTLYTLPKMIKDPNAEIVIWCRTSRRARYAAAFLEEYGYKNVWVWDKGIVGWMKEGKPLVNQFLGKFKVTEYHKMFKEQDKDGNPKYRIRSFHPY